MTSRGGSLGDGVSSVSSLIWEARARRVARRRRLPTLDDALGALRALPPERDPPEDAPVFILATSWRSGSTLLQRLVLSSHEVMIWGEPLAKSGWITSLAESMLPFGLRDYPGSDQVLSADTDTEALLGKTWAANLSPEPAHLREAHRQFFRTLLAEPAAAVGRGRWGLKEVHLDASHARYLQWLFPRAVFVVLHRNPYDSYRSYRGRHGPPWFQRWPEDQVTTVARFAEIWRHQTAGLLAAAGDLHALTVGYEDLASDGSTIDQLEAHLGITVDRGVGSVSLRGPVSDAAPSLPARELRVLRRVTGPLARSLGYHGPS